MRKYNIFDVGNNQNYFDEKKNVEILKKISKKCYLPTNALLLKLLNKHEKFKVAFSFSGVFLEQLEQYEPKVLESFMSLVNTGKVELLSETYYHSLAYLYSKREFKEQVDMHRNKIRELFGVSPTVFRNTELIYNNDMAKYVENLGYKAILSEGADHILGWRSPNFVYRPIGCNKIKVLMKNYRLSDDIAFRFSDRKWKGWPLTAEKFAGWINNINGNGECVNLFMDYETFGEHQWKDTGIFEFLGRLPEEILKHPDNEFMMPLEIAKLNARDMIDVHEVLSWADIERDLSAWMGNRMQQSALKRLYELENDVKESGDLRLIENWRRLQTSDHFYYMCTKWFADGDVHKYFNPYDSPYDSFIAFVNIINDLVLRLKKLKENKWIKVKQRGAKVA